MLLNPVVGVVPEEFRANLEDAGADVTMFVPRSSPYFFFSLALSS